MFGAAGDSGDLSGSEVGRWEEHGWVLELRGWEDFYKDILVSSNGNSSCLFYFYFIPKKLPQSSMRFGI